MNIRRFWPQAGLSFIALLAFVLPAHAGLVVFNPTGGSWSNTGSCAMFGQSVSASGLPAGSYVTGVDVSGQANTGPVSSGSCAANLTATENGNGTGTTEPFSSSTIPASWSFTAGGSQATSVTWSLVYTVDGLTTTESGSLPSDQTSTVTGSGLINVDGGNTLSSWSIALTVALSLPAFNGASVAFNNPNGLEIDSQDTAVPEPGNFFLLAPAALLLLRRRSRRRA